MPFFRFTRKLAVVQSRQTETQRNHTPAARSLATTGGCLQPEQCVNGADEEYHLGQRGQAIGVVPRALPLTNVAVSDRHGAPRARELRPTATSMRMAGCGGHRVAGPRARLSMNAAAAGGDDVCRAGELGLASRCTPVAIRQAAWVEHTGGRQPGRRTD